MAYYFSGTQLILPANQGFVCFVVVVVVVVVLELLL